MNLKWIFTLGIVICGCHSQEQTDRYLSRDIVVRTVQPMSQKSLPPVIPDTPATAIPKSHSQKLRYHIIVSSFGSTEKESAQKVADQLKAKKFPASLIFSSQRYRVSIESFPTEAEAGNAIGKYREIMKRQDLWILKTD